MLGEVTDAVKGMNQLYFRSDWRTPVSGYRSIWKSGFESRISFVTLSYAIERDLAVGDITRWY